MDLLSTDSEPDSDLEFLANKSNHGPKFDISCPSSSNKNYTHHELDLKKCKYFLYPTSGDIQTRDYQRNIIRKALVRNVLCVLPTGLGKTFIASTVMLNWYNWTKTAKLVFIAPTRPLVIQQAVGFLRSTGISINDTIALLNDIATKSDRKSLWTEKRCVFATSQTVENDIDQNILDPRQIVLLVIDEAHHTQKDHSYASLVRKVKKANQCVRILALTATPSASLEQVQQMIFDMDINLTEIRQEESIDIQSYINQRNIERIRVDFSFEQREILKLLASATREQFDILRKAKICHNFDVVDSNSFIIRQELQRYMSSDSHKAHPKPHIFFIRAVAMQMATLAYNVQLLKEHGIVPFFSRMKKMELELMGSKGKTSQMLIQKDEFKEVMHITRVIIYGVDKGPTYKYTDADRKLDFYSHPKLEQMILKIDHFIRSHGADSRIIVFSEFRDSAAEILWALKNYNNDTVRASLFVGQATATNSDVKGMSQKEQRTVLEKFKQGGFNLLIATSIGEEGLDIGQVDLIICYDQSKSPIRNIQRIGRTGRKRTGNVIFFMTQQEERKLVHAFKNYSWICEKINSSSSETNHAYSDAEHARLLLKLKYTAPNRMLPPDIEPKYTEFSVVQPPENEAVLCNDDNELNVVKAMKLYVNNLRKSRKPSKKYRKTQSDLFDVGFVNASEVPD